MFPELPGISNADAQKLLTRFGPNSLPQQPLPSQTSLFLSQLKSPLVYILLAAGLITLLLNHISDSLIIFIAVFINTILGFVQERKANQSLASLKNLLPRKRKLSGKESI